MYRVYLVHCVYGMDAELFEIFMTVFEFCENWWIWASKICARKLSSELCFNMCFDMYYRGIVMYVIERNMCYWHVVNIFVVEVFIENLKAISHRFGLNAFWQIKCISKKKIGGTNVSVAAPKKIHRQCTPGHDFQTSNADFEIHNFQRAT